MHLQAYNHPPPPPPPPPRAAQQTQPIATVKTSRFRNVRAETAGYDINFPIQQVPPSTTIPDNQKSLVPRQNDIVMKKYATSVDERNFLTVYEYSVNQQWVIWDYYTGYVHLTGLWKAIGNSKADIVKLVDNSPDLEPVIRRVRGGFLKIQGTWLPFATARALASRTCYHIRYALIPIFGVDFPDSCLKPGEPGFGQLQLRLTDPNKRRKKRTLSMNATLNSNSNNEDRRKRTKSENHRSPRPLLQAQVQRVAQGYVPHYPVFQQHHRTKSTSHLYNQGLPRLQPSPLIHQQRDDDENAVESQSSSDNEDYRPVVQQRPRAQTMPSQYHRAPPLPEKVSVSGRLSESSRELLEALHATRQLQQLSSGRRWSLDQSYGGGFECGGKLWRWDGRNTLDVVAHYSNNDDDSVPPPLSPSSSVSSRRGQTASPRTPGVAAVAASPMIVVETISSTNTTPRFQVTHTAETAAKRSIMDINGLLS